MELKIPDDWDGSTWTRFCVCWPDSPDWRRILLGFLSFPKRGRAWDEETGIIKDVQAIGEQIWNLNNELEEVVLACNEATLLIKSHLLLVAAITGTEIDLSGDDLEDLISQNWDFTSIGLANRIGPERPHDSPDNVVGVLQLLELEATNIFEEIRRVKYNLAKVYGSLDDQTTILGGEISPPPDPIEP